MFLIPRGQKGLLELVRIYYITCTASHNIILLHTNNTNCFRVRINSFKIIVFLSIQVCMLCLDSFFMLFLLNNLFKMVFSCG